MSQIENTLYQKWMQTQADFFPAVDRNFCKLTEKQQQLIEVLEIANVEQHITYVGASQIGRPISSRSAIARAFIAKAVYNMPTTEVLIDRLLSDIKLRRICGWERENEVPSRATFSRAFTEFAYTKLTERVHETLILNHMGKKLVGHISRDSTAIIAREKPVLKGKAESKPKKRGRPKKGEVRIKEPTRLEKQSSGITVKQMLNDLPSKCSVGTKRNSKGYKSSWIGYKLHIDSSDGGVPVSCILSSASMHDSQAAIPLAEMTSQRVSSCYDLMDAAYDSPLIKAHSQALGHIPIIDSNPRTQERKAEKKLEQKRAREANYKSAELVRYNERSTVERVNGRLKDDFGARVVRVRGNSKVMAHLMFGVIALTVEQLMRFAL